MMSKIEKLIKKYNYSTWAIGLGFLVILIDSFVENNIVFYPMNITGGIFTYVISMTIFSEWMYLNPTQNKSEFVFAYVLYFIIFFLWLPFLFSLLPFLIKIPYYYF